MSSRQRESTAKFLYDMAKGIGLIAVVGGMVSGQVSWWRSAPHKWKWTRARGVPVALLLQRVRNHFLKWR